MLLGILRDPLRIRGLPQADQSLLLRFANITGLAGHLGARLAELDALDACPAPLRDHLRGGVVRSESDERMLRWEVQQIVRAVEGLDIPLVLLKGAAYVFLGLSFAHGRRVSDVDVLVPRARIGEVEQALLARGWGAERLADYDDRYYRELSHELPPLRHRSRLTIADIHHSIAPPGARLALDPEALLEDSLPLDGHELVRVLSPVDMVLHKCVHLFHDGELRNSLRELVDLDGLLRYCDGRAGCWARLVPRARRFGVLRPLYYGLRYTRLLLDTPIPPAVHGDARQGRPPWPLAWLMDRLVIGAFHTPHPDRIHPLRALGAWLLYVRSHWLRMPPLQLARHLAIKSWMRLRGEADK